jgi:hypothetical protein
MFFIFEIDERWMQILDDDFWGYYKFNKYNYIFSSSFCACLGQNKFITMILYNNLKINKSTTFFVNCKISKTIISSLKYFMLLY